MTATLTPEAYDQIASVFRVVVCPYCGIGRRYANLRAADRASRRPHRCPRGPKRLLDAWKALWTPRVDDMNDPVYVRRIMRMRGKKVPIDWMWQRVAKRWARRVGH